MERVLICTQSRKQPGRQWEVLVPQGHAEQVSFKPVYALWLSKHAFEEAQESGALGRRGGRLVVGQLTSAVCPFGVIYSCKEGTDLGWPLLRSGGSLQDPHAFLHCFFLPLSHIPGIRLSQKWLLSQ